MSLQIGFRNKRLLREWTTDRKCHLMQLKSGIGPPLRTAYGCRKWRQGRFCSISFCKNRCKASLWLIDVLAAVHDQFASEAQSSETSSLRSRQGSYEQVWKSFRRLDLGRGNHWRSCLLLLKRLWWKGGWTAQPFGPETWCGPKSLEKPGFD